MLNITAHTRALTITDAAATLHVPLPTAYLEQVANAEAFAEAAHQTVCQKATLHRVVLDAVEEGRNYLTDKGIQAMALNAQLTEGNILADVRKRTEQLLFAALRDHADDILASWADALDDHAAKLAAAAKSRRETQGRRRRRLTRRRDYDPPAQRAGRREGMVDSRARLPHAGCRRRRQGQRNPVTVLTPARLAELEPAFEMARDERAREVGAWVLARDGIPLRLATLDEFTRRATQLKKDAEDESRRLAARANAAGFSR